jgi:hypothetical protein
MPRMRTAEEKLDTSDDVIAVMHTSLRELGVSFRRPVPLLETRGCRLLAHWPTVHAREYWEGAQGPCTLLPSLSELS